MVLVDRGSDNKKAMMALAKVEDLFWEKGWTLIRENKSLGPGPARNLAAKHGPKSTFLIFLDEHGYFSHPHAVQSESPF